MFYGWVILGVSTVAIAATSPGQSYLVGQFNASIEEALGISEASLTAAYGIATFLAAFPLLYVGKLSDRYGPRIIMGLSALALGGACWAIGFAQGPVSLGVCYFLLRFAGQGCLGLSASHSVALWFERKLGRANGIKMFAMPMVILTLPFLATFLIAEFGWKTAYGIFGVAVWVAVLPLVVFLHRNKPEDLGQRVDGDPPAGTPPHPLPHAHPDAELIAGAETDQPLAADLVDEPLEAPEEICFTRQQAMATRVYWLIAAALIANALIGTAFVFLMSKLAATAGLGEGGDDRMLAVFALASAVFGPLAGIATDRFAPRWMISSASAMLGLSCALFAAASSPLMAGAAMVALAAAQSNIFVSGLTLFARFFGRPHHGAIRASLTFFMVAGTSVGPFMTSALARVAGYDGALWVFAAVCVPIAVSGLLVKAPEPPPTDEPSRGRKPAGHREDGEPT